MLTKEMKSAAKAAWNEAAMKKSEMVKTLNPDEIIEVVAPHLQDNDHLRESMEEIDRLAEAGLCQMSVYGKHAFLNDIRRKVAELGLQGGLTPYGS